MFCRKTALISLFVAALMPVIASAQFETRSINLSSPVPYGAAVGDLNHDGKIDLAFGTPYPNGASIMMGNGDGTFAAPVVYPVPNTPDTPAIGDFNGDGNLDIALANSDGNPGAVYVLLGNGDGTFRPAETYAMPPYSCCVQVADLNNDHKLDLIMLCGDSICTLLGNGDGTFQEPAAVTVPPEEPSSFGIGDFNHDGTPDIVAMIDFSGKSSAEIMLGNGDGTFTYSASYPVSSPSSVAIADLNHDHNLDLVVTDAAALEISVLLGNGDGSFQPAVTYSSGCSVWAAVADFNGDGVPDIVAADLNSGVTVYTGNGDGTFHAGIYYSVGDDNHWLAVGDFNSDDKIDIIVPSLARGNVGVMLNTGAVRFTPTTPLTFRGQLVGTTSPVQTVILTNNGTEALSISSMEVKGEFALKSNCRSGVAPGGTCSMRVSFTPRSQGEKSGVISIVDSASTKPQVIDLSGQATVVQLSTTQIDFGSEQVGSTSARQEFQITNTSSRPIVFSRVTINGNEAKDFSQTNDCPTSLGAGASCGVSVTFSPKKKGSRNATLDVIDSGGASPQVVNVSGTGS